VFLGRRFALRLLKFLRIERKLSQHALAATRNIVPQPELLRIESGRTNPTDRELEAPARVLGGAPERLLDHLDATALGEGADFTDTQRSGQ
jgi:transcriptional regulator with XRE-family HTH domain